MRLGRYEVGDQLGRGASAVVLRGTGPEGEALAIKVLAARPSPGALARFDRERRLLAQLGLADGFVPLLDAGTTPD